MRGTKLETQGMFSYVSLEQQVPHEHPLRAIRVIMDRSLTELDSHFNTIYSAFGRPSIPPEFLLRALLLQVFYSVRSERQLIEQLNYNLLFRWFVGLAMDEEVWMPPIFTKNQDRLPDHGTVQAFLQSVLEQGRSQDLLSEGHFSVDTTLLEAWVSQRSFHPQDPEDRQGDGSDFRGQTLSNETHASATNPDARVYKRVPGEAGRLAYLGHVLNDNRHGLIAGEQVTTADGTAEVDAATELINTLGGAQRITLGADQGYDCLGFVQDLRERNVPPTCRPQSQRLYHRPTHYLSHRLCHEHSCSPANRVHLRLDEDRRRNAQNAIPWIGSVRTTLVPRRYRLQSDPHDAIGAV